LTVALSTCFDPLALPFQRAQTYVDPNPPEVLSDEFYNPAQDALARLWGGAAGYSTSWGNDEFVLTQSFAGVGPPAGTGFGEELAVFSNQGANFDFGSVAPTAAGAHGVYQVKGLVAGNRGAGTGFGVADSARYLGTMRWLFRSRMRVGKVSTLTATGLTVGLGLLSANAPLWVVNGSTGYWQTFCDGGANPTAVAAIDDQWITLWIGLKDADAVVRWYYQRDGIDARPVLADTQTLVTANLTSVERTVRYLVNNTAVASDYIEIDSIGMICER
jgi:hypothetical protein